MNQRLAQISIVVRDYDEAINFYTKILGFDLVEDTLLSPEKRWVLVKPKSTENGCMLLLAKASTPEQERAIGNQTGGRVFLFLFTDDMERDFILYQERGVAFVNEPRLEAYGKVAVFSDLYGNLWDLIQPSTLKKI
ncbi:MAG: VOC family protein [Chitinophagaceae bacterium]|nr:MAG: VOC family protein [Chitinophagaceae bacterium]